MNLQQIQKYIMHISLDKLKMLVMILLDALITITNVAFVISNK